jgi:hypothetical protein
MILHNILAIIGASHVGRAKICSSICSESNSFHTINIRISS